ncbi:Nucleotide-sugar transporter [Teratosphaeria destructans]|uniref:Nucleotide-sugar transporter n=1 Tax=Teratosphaeria destructans TaxID=418781 RepID=A0A9W7W390_9PEZI|nr:Nucleotide-sugar transporter [Teratosphaeria destructans]
MAVKALVPILVGMMLLTGCCNTLLTKFQDMQCVADCDSAEPKRFEQPVLQTLQMFIGESGCWLVVFFSWLFKRVGKPSATTPAQDILYEPVGGRDEDDGHREVEEEVEGGMSTSQTLADPTNILAKPFVDAEDEHQDRKPLTGWKITLLALPSICDICGTTLMNVGLLFVAASIYQMTRGALVLFVGLFSVIFLKRHLNGWKWGSLFIVVAGVALVGLAGALERKHGKSPADLPGDTMPPPADEEQLLLYSLRVARDTISTFEAHSAAETVLGVFMIAGAQIFTASQFVLEESIMEKYSMDPIQVVGWEGVFGFLVTLLGTGVLHAAVGRTPAGKGGYFDAREGFYEMFHNPAIAVSSLLIMISIGGFNFFGLSVTRVISATSRSTIDTCRTLFIWIVSLGLGWETFKWLQVAGFVLLVWGTGIFNEIVNPPTVAFLRRRRQGISL